MRIEIIAKMPQAFVHECSKSNFTRLTGTDDFRRTQFDTFPPRYTTKHETNPKNPLYDRTGFSKNSIEVRVKNPLDLRVGWRLLKMKESDPIVLGYENRETNLF